ncbi:MAG: putative thiol:disulfide interchange protein DsbC precursor [Syntrophorhabdus sp. PtaU1.Bin050]|nr:MAG: putative thiol:disulfide interchange protein DsbC precursor [Syntrophorhabdus sp. PtaU1.Bin050]
MKKEIIAFCLVCLMVMGVWSIVSAESVEETFKKMFPQIQVEGITQTGIKGVYEVVSHNQIGYFAPEPGYLLLGEIIDKNGVNITANRRNEVIASKTKSLPLDKALKIGEGKNTIIEFTDPDCPYCRKASALLRQKTDVTRYVFFFPLPMHADAENKVRYIFCSSDRVKAYEEAMQGKLDDQKYDTCRKQEAKDLLKIHKEAGEKIGINSTPFFIVNNKPISGANMPQINEALKQK